MKKILISIIIIVLLAGFLYVVLAPRGIYNSIIDTVSQSIVNVIQQKVERKEGESKAIQKSIKGLEKKSQELETKIMESKEKVKKIEPSKNVKELREGFAKLGYPSK